MTPTEALANNEQHAKEVVNEIRHSRGERRLAKLKRGIPMHPGCCTIAMSLPCRYANRNHMSGRVWLDDREPFVDKQLAQFMKDFDDGFYPHLEIPKTPIKIKKPGERKLTVIG